MAILEAVFPVFAIAFLGYLAAALKLLSTVDIAGMSRFVFTIAIPVLLFNTLAHMELPAQLNWQFLLCYYLIALTIFGLGALTKRFVFAGSLKEQGIFGLGCSYSNLILVGLPIISAGFGDAGLLPLFILVSFHSATLFFVATLLVERDPEDGGLSRWHIVRQTFKNLIRNPIIIGLVLFMIR